MAFYALNNFIWFALDTVPPYNDSAHHLTNYHTIRNILSGSFGPQEVMNYDDMLYAPVYYYVAVLISWLVGDVAFVYILVNLLFYAMLLTAVYAIGKKIFGITEGIFSCIVLSFYPYLYGATRIFIIEIALCSLAALCICFLLYSEELRSARFTVASALVCLVGMLTKQSFLIYVIGPMAFVIGKALIRRNAWKEMGFLICIGVVTPIIFLYFLFNNGTEQLFFCHIRDAKLYAIGGHWEKVFYYFRLLPDQINWFSVVLFVIGATGYIFNLARTPHSAKAGTGAVPAIEDAGRAKPELISRSTLFIRRGVFTKMSNKSFLLIWLLVPLLILMAAPLKDSKYSLPCLPAIALVSSWCLYAITKPIARYLLVAAVLVFGIFVHYALLFNNALIDSLGGMNFDLKPYTEYVHKPRHMHLDKVQEMLFESLQKHITPSGICHIGVTSFSLSPKDLFNSTNVRCTDNFMVVNVRGMKNFIAQHHLPFIVRELGKDTNLCASANSVKFKLLVTALPLDKFFPGWEQCYKQTLAIVVPSDHSKIYIYERK